MDSSNHYYTQQSQSQSSQQSIGASAFQSSSSLSSMGSISTSPSQTSMNSRHSPSFSSAAPLPSPSNQQQYFTQLPAPLAQENMNPFQQRPQRGSFSQGQQGNGAGLADTASYLQDFSLIAEAAKRAQVAVMMRDFDDLEM